LNKTIRLEVIASQIMIISSNTENSEIIDPKEEIIFQKMRRSG
jgi:hypothetical protein